MEPSRERDGLFGAHKNMKNKDINASESHNMSTLYNIVRVIAVIFLVIQIVVVSYVVFGRFVLNKTPRWGEEFSLLCMVWFCLLSASMAEYNRAHIGVKLNKFFLPPRGIHLIEIINHLIKIGIALFMIVAGFQLVKTTWGGILPGLGISTAWLYLSVPVSGIFFLAILSLRLKEVFIWETP